MLLLKLLLVPAFLAAVSLAGRRWGPWVAGWLSGLPVVAGPILFFLALERGAEFAAAGAIAALSAQLCSVSFNVAFSWVGLRARWPAALLAALGSWLSVAAGLSFLPPSLGLSAGIAVAALVLGPFCFPRIATPGMPQPLPPSEVWLRMGAGAALVIFVTAIAENVGPGWSGLLSVFPVLGSVLASFSHKASGPLYAAEFLKAMVRGQYAFVAFSLVLALMLPRAGIAPSFIAAVAAALAASTAARFVRR